MLTSLVFGTVANPFTFHMRENQGSYQNKQHCFNLVQMQSVNQEEVESRFKSNIRGGGILCFSINLQ